MLTGYASFSVYDTSNSLYFYQFHKISQRDPNDLQNYFDYQNKYIQMQQPPQVQR